MTLTELAKCSMTLSIARPLCDSWTSCYAFAWWRAGSNRFVFCLTVFPYYC